MDEALFNKLKHIRDGLGTTPVQIEKLPDGRVQLATRTKSYQAFAELDALIKAEENIKETN